MIRLSKHMGAFAGVLFLCAGMGAGRPDLFPLVLSVSFIAYGAGWMDGSNSAARYMPLADIEAIRTKDHRGRDALDRLAFGLGVGVLIGTLVRPNVRRVLLGWLGWTE